MKNKIANTNFKESLKQKIPHKSQLTKTLCELLQVEKEAVYRRMRGEVPFSFEEIALLSQRLGISLDYILGIEAEKRPFSMEFVDFENPTEKEYAIWQKQNDILTHFVHNGSFETFETWTIVPFPYCYQFPWLTKFYIYKWSYLVNNHIPLKRFNELKLDEKFYTMALEYFHLHQQASGSQHIVSNTIFSDLINDIQFFYDLNCISEEDRHMIYQDMERCMDNLELIVAKGEYEQTGKKVNVYVTDLTIDSNYTLIKSDNFYICLLRTLNLNSLITSDQATFNYMSTCFSSLKRLTTHISFSGERDRIKYFGKERKLLETMKG